MRSRFPHPVVHLPDVPQVGKADREREEEMMELIEKYKEKWGARVRENRKGTIHLEYAVDLMNKAIDELYGCLPDVDDTENTCLASKAPYPFPYPEEISFLNGREEVIEDFNSNLKKLVEGE